MKGGGERGEGREEVKGGVDRDGGGEGKVEVEVKGGWRWRWTVVLVFNFMSHPSNCTSRQ